MNERIEECNSSLKELTELLASAEAESFLDEALCVIYETSQGCRSLSMVVLPILQSHAETLIANALLEFTPSKLVMSYNGGKDCTVLLDMVWKVWKRFPEFSKIKLKTVYVAENDPFPELENFISDTVERYPFIELYTYRTGLKEAFLQFSEEKGLDNYAIFIGTRRTDPYCENLQEINSSDNGWPKFTRISPVLNWGYSQIWKYIDSHRIEYCQLYNEGYTSLGSRSKTIPNPELESVDGKYLHARMLKDAKFERLGRSK